MFDRAEAERKIGAWLQKKRAAKVEKSLQEEQRRAPLSFGSYLSLYLKGWCGYKYESVHAPTISRTPLLHAHYRISRGYAVVFFVVDNEEAVSEFQVVSESDFDSLAETAKEVISRGENNEKIKSLFLCVYEVDNQPLSESRKEALLEVKSPTLTLRKNRYDFCHVNTSTQEVWSNTEPLLGNYNLRRLKRIIKQERVPEETLQSCEMSFGANPKTVPYVGFSFLAIFAGIFLLSVYRASGLGLVYALPSSLTRSLGALIVSDSGLFEILFRAGTSSFLHSSLEHLLYNAFSFFLGALTIERLLGRAWLLLSFTLGVLGGGLMFYFLSPPQASVLGASGGILGMLTLSLAVLQFRMPFGPTTSAFYIYLMAGVVGGLLPIFENVSYTSHFGGALTGAFLGLLACQSWTKYEHQPRDSALVIILAIPAFFFLSLCALTVVIRLL